MRELIPSLSLSLSLPLFFAATAFINSSCPRSANLSIKQTWSEHRDIDLFTPVFVAKHNIEADEELYFCYDKASKKGANACLCDHCVDAGRGGGGGSSNGSPRPPPGGGDGRGSGSGAGGGHAKRKRGSSDSNEGGGGAESESSAKQRKKPPAPREQSMTSQSHSEQVHGSSSVRIPPAIDRSVSVLIGVGRAKAPSGAYTWCAYHGAEGEETIIGYGYPTPDAAAAAHDRSVKAAGIRESLNTNTEMVMKKKMTTTTAATTTMESRSSTTQTKKNESRYSFVFWSRRQAMWFARVRGMGCGGKDMALGLFKHEDEAARAVDACIIANGIERELNFPSAAKRKSKGTASSSPSADSSRGKTSRFKYVSLDRKCKASKKWRAKVQHGGKIFFRETFGDEEDAARAVDACIIANGLEKEKGLNFPLAAKRHSGGIASSSSSAGSYKKRKRTASIASEYSISGSDDDDDDESDSNDEEVVEESGEEDDEGGEGDSSAAPIARRGIIRKPAPLFPFWIRKGARATLMFEEDDDDDDDDFRHFFVTVEKVIGLVPESVRFKFDIDGTSITLHVDELSESDVRPLDRQHDPRDGKGLSRKAAAAWLKRMSKSVFKERNRKKEKQREEAKAKRKKAMAMMMKKKKKKKKTSSPKKKKKKKKTKMAKTKTLEKKMKEEEEDEDDEEDTAMVPKKRRAAAVSEATKMKATKKIKVANKVPAVGSSGRLAALDALGSTSASASAPISAAAARLPPPPPPPPPPVIFMGTILKATSNGHETRWVLHLKRGSGRKFLRHFTSETKARRYKHDYETGKRSLPNGW